MSNDPLCGKSIDELPPCVLKADHEEPWHLNPFGYTWSDGDTFTRKGFPPLPHEQAAEVERYHDPRFDADLRNAICGWLRENGIDPGLVPADEKPDCSYRDGGGVPLGGHTITTRIRVRVSPDSKAHTIRYLTNRLEETTITKPMKVAPSALIQAWLDSKCPACGR